MSLIAELEAQLVLKLAQALTLEGQAHPKVEVIAWPQAAREWKMTHPFGAALVIYKGAKFNAANFNLAFEADFEIALLSRTLRNATIKNGDPEGVGIYGLLETCRNALLGWVPPSALDAIKLKTEAYSDYTEGTWGYSMAISVPMLLTMPSPPPMADINASGEHAPALERFNFTEI